MNRAASHCVTVCLHSGPYVRKVRARTVRNKALQLIGKATKLKLKRADEHGGIGASLGQGLMRGSQCAAWDRRRVSACSCLRYYDIMLTV